MEKTLFELTDKNVTRDQSLALQSKILDYFRNALTLNKGYMVFEVVDASTFEFDFYYSSGSEIRATYEETREETVARIVYTIDCAELRSIENIDEYLSDIMRYIFNFIVGFISAGILWEQHGVKDHSAMFIDNFKDLKVKHSA